MPAPSPKTVWILGAGFSKPLGGPLLPDLFSSHMAAEIAVRFGNAASFIRDDTSRLVYWLYAYGRAGRERVELPPFPEKKKGGPGDFFSARTPSLRGIHGIPTEDIWRDAEEFLDMLDTAARDSNGSRAKRIARAFATAASDDLEVPTVGMLELSAAARRIVAAECAAFLIGQAADSERWHPYREWASKLTENDTIITFNYDLIPERLHGALAKNPIGGFLGPQHRVVTSKDGLQKPGSARVLKLHGSVNWRLSDDGSTYATAADDLVLNCSGNVIAIGMPGPAKQLATVGPFAWLWQAAESAIREADRIYFVGYRFPESDALARHRILGAIRECKAPHLEVHTVLGPNNADTPRLHSLLRWATKGSKKPVAHPLWTQDFLSVWEPDIKAQWE